tara:strand:- start:8032 stop:9243 length:1212 start_codon:yes stop_codon:yes gene_type:complete
VHVRGSNKNTEYKREDHSFYRGIVLDNQDPNKLMRLKIFIPELSNQPYDSWFSDYDNGTQEMRYPGAIGPLTKDSVDQLKQLIPWAEQMAPLMGESGTSHYFAPEGEQRSKATYVKTSTQSTAPNSEIGGGQPRSTIANTNAASITDAWADGKYGKTNTSGGQGYTPKNSGPDAAGVYGIPPVGAHVWVFHHRGDLNFPVYVGVSPSYRDTGLVWNQDEQTYPASYESNTGDSPNVEDTPPDPDDPRGAQLIPGQGIPGSNLTEMVKEFESGGNNDPSYWDYKQWTIGYGTRAVGNERQEGATISDAEADRRLQQELQQARSDVIRQSNKIGRSFNKNQLDALTSFTFNTGSGNMRTLLQGGRRSNQEIADSILLYNQAGGNVLRGLQRRRQAERELFLNGYS